MHGRTLKERGLFRSSNVIFNLLRQTTTSHLGLRLQLSTSPSPSCSFSIFEFIWRLKRDKEICLNFKLGKRTLAADPILGLFASFPLVIWHALFHIILSTISFCIGILFYINKDLLSYVYLHICRSWLHANNYSKLDTINPWIV